MKRMTDKKLGRLAASACFMLSLAIVMTGCGDKAKDAEPDTSSSSAAETTTASSSAAESKEESSSEEESKAESSSEAESKADSSSATESKAETPEITMDSIIKANDINTMFANHKSVSFEFKTTGSEDVFRVYTSPDLTYEDLGAAIVIIDKDSIWQIDDNDGEQVLSYYWYAMEKNEETAARITPTDYSFIDSTFTSRENIDSVKENDDGTLTIITKLSPEDTDELLMAQQPDYTPGESKAEQRTEYVVNKDTLEISSASATLVLDGEEVSTTSVSLAFDEDQPENLDSLKTLIKEAKSDKESAKRTVKTVYDNGTDDEKTYTYKANERYRVITCIRDGYYSLYKDPDKNEFYEGDTGESELTIYTFAGE